MGKNHPSLEVIYVLLFNVFYEHFIIAVLLTPCPWALQNNERIETEKGEGRGGIGKI